MVGEYGPADQQKRDLWCQHAEDDHGEEEEGGEEEELLLVLLVLLRQRD